ncbi:hypothetical protein GCM10007887_03630 [Methylobacterium haplocladii]|uniref:Uncharacterized protein n=1 Tax=Methylobacterium haplocladii TaxID=1176176 RepID=A0A512ILP9_9HYPH|nr:hypothetical protein MHA02_10310 [Methylobacterium haplocladii]GLS57707.1 hypothetical protein GCM10007887_03630 [Methylobacterium haplocladii]
MDEHVPAPGIRLYEAVTLDFIEPFDGASLHAFISVWSTPSEERVSGRRPEAIAAVDVEKVVRPRLAVTRTVSKDMRSTGLRDEN